MRAVCGKLCAMALVVAALLRPGIAAVRGAAATNTPHLLRYAFGVAETGFDPAQLSDLYSRYVTAHIFESPDGQGLLELACGPSTGKANFARFKLPAFNQLYDDLRFVPDGPRRQALFDAATLLLACAPYRMSVHRVLTDLAHSALIGYRRAPLGSTGGCTSTSTPPCRPSLAARGRGVHRCKQAPGLRA